MHVELRPLSEVRPYHSNPRRNDHAVDAVAASIAAYGFRQPIVVDSDGVIVVGHTRYKAALKLGLTHAPVHVARDLSPDKARAYRLADNQTATLATWDEQLLSGEMAALKALDIDIASIGFDQERLAELFGLPPPEAPPETAPEVTERVEADAGVAP